MIEKVNPSHPDKVADRIAGAIVDLAYTKNDNPKIAVELTLGHGKCFIIIETSEHITKKEVQQIVNRIAEQKVKLYLTVVPQDKHLADNQKEQVKCGDNGIFKGITVTREEKELSEIAYNVYKEHSKLAGHQADGKYVYVEKDSHLIVCQSYCSTKYASIIEHHYYKKGIEYITVNPLGDWTGGINVDTGAVNRKLGSDMAQSVSGGGLFGKDISKADVSVNIYAWLKSQITRKRVELYCAIGDTYIDGRPYQDVVEIAKEYIDKVGGFEKFAEWGLVRPKECDINLKDFTHYFGGEVR